MKGRLSAKMSSFLAVIPEDVEWMARDLLAVILGGQKTGATSVFKALHGNGLIEIVGRSPDRGSRALKVWRLTEYGKAKKRGDMDGE